MNYFENRKLARMLGVSEGSIRRWIKEAQQGKNDLQLYEQEGTLRIANTGKNSKLIEELVSHGKSWARRWHKTVKPTTEFYELYSKEQIIDIITSLETYRDIPKQYSYFGAGAKRWDEYASRLWEEEEGNTLTTTVELLENNTSNIVRLLGDYEKVNVVDLGVGNALPVKELLTNLSYDKAVLGRYIGVDISQDMLDLAERNIKQWFGSEISFEGHVLDFTYQPFNELSLTSELDSTANLVLLLGGTLENVHTPDDIFRIIHRSMGQNDLLVTSNKLDSEESRRYFDFHTEGDLPKLPLDRRLMLASLGIEESLYEGEQGYDPTHKVRFNQARLNLDITIEFEIDNQPYPVKLNKGEAISLWIATHYTVNDVLGQLERNGFDLREASISKDGKFLLTISKVAHTTYSGFKAA